MVYLEITDPAIEPQAFLQQCRSRGLDFLQTDACEFRMVTHYGIEKSHINDAIRIIREAVNSVEI